MLAMVAHAPNVMVPHRGSGFRRQGADGVPEVSKASRSRYPRAAGMITTGQLKLWPNTGMRTGKLHVGRVSPGATSHARPSL